VDAGVEAVRVGLPRCRRVGVPVDRSRLMRRLVDGIEGEIEVLDRRPVEHRADPPRRRLLRQLPVPGVGGRAAIVDAGVGDFRIDLEIRRDLPGQLRGGRPGGIFVGFISFPYGSSPSQCAKASSADSPISVASTIPSSGPDSSASLPSCSLNAHSHAHRCRNATRNRPLQRNVVFVGNVRNERQADEG
jgi:hypothetical protein